MRIRSPLLTKLAAKLAVFGVWLLFRTVKVEIRTECPGVDPYDRSQSDRFLYCLWHDSLLIHICAKPLKSMAGLVSRHQDGSYLTVGMEALGIKAVRGSTNRGGSQAVRQLMKTIRNRNVAITPDGPRGPRREMKEGIIFLASHTGRGIVATTSACTRAWRIPAGWSDLVLPKPFSTVYILGAAPLEVPPDLSKQDFSRYADLLQRRMNHLQEMAEQFAQGATPEWDAPAADPLRRSA